MPSNNNTTKISTKLAVMLRYSDAERRSYLREQKLKSWISKLNDLLSLPERALILQCAQDYISAISKSTVSKSEPYNLVVAACVYHLKKQGKITSIALEIPKVISILGGGSRSNAVKPGSMLKTAKNIKEMCPT